MLKEGHNIGFSTSEFNDDSIKYVMQFEIYDDSYSVHNAICGLNKTDDIIKAYDTYLEQHNMPFRVVKLLGYNIDRGSKNTNEPNSYIQVKVKTMPITLHKLQDLYVRELDGDLYTLVEDDGIFVEEIYN